MALPESMAMIALLVLQPPSVHEGSRLKAWKSGRLCEQMQDVDRLPAPGQYEM